MQQQIDDLLGKQDHLQQIIRDLKWNQAKLDQELAEERSISARYAEERDRAETEAREKDSRVLALTWELESQRDSKEALKGELESASAEHDRDMAAVQAKLSMALTDVVARRPSGSAAAAARRPSGSAAAAARRPSGSAGAVEGLSRKVFKKHLVTILR